VDIIGDLSRIRTLLSENVIKNSDDNEILMDLLTFLIPDHSTWDDGFFRDPKTLELRKVYMEYSVNKEKTELKKETPDEYFEGPKTEYTGVVYLNIEKLDVLDTRNNIIIENADYYDVPEYIFERFEDELSAVCFRYGLNVYFDFIGNGTNEDLAH